MNLLHSSSRFMLEQAQNAWTDPDCRPNKFPNLAKTDSKSSWKVLKKSWFLLISISFDLTTNSIRFWCCNVRFDLYSTRLYGNDIFLWQNWCGKWVNSMDLCLRHKSWILGKPIGRVLCLRHASQFLENPSEGFYVWGIHLNSWETHRKGFMSQACISILRQPNRSVLYFRHT